VYRDGNLVSGSLDALLQHVVPTSDYFPDRAYLFAFLLSARLFIKPHELLGEVCQRCDAQHKQAADPRVSSIHLRTTINQIICLNYPCSVMDSIGTELSLPQIDKSQSQSEMIKTYGHFL
jgi:hypothetical protein